jgi:hypothetical protein
MCAGPSLAPPAEKAAANLELKDYGLSAASVPGPVGVPSRQP